MHCTEMQREVASDLQEIGYEHGIGCLISSHKSIVCSRTRALSIPARLQRTAVQTQQTAPSHGPRPGRKGPQNK